MEKKAPTGDAPIEDCALPTQESIASKLGSAVSVLHRDLVGILSVCGSTGADHEQQRAQHDVIGGTYVRMLGFHEKVAHLIEV